MKYIRDYAIPISMLSIVCMSEKMKTSMKFMKYAKTLACNHIKKWLKWGKINKISGSANVE